jgi:hypothetical protein
MTHNRLQHDRCMLKTRYASRASDPRPSRAEQGPRTTDNGPRTNLHILSSSSIYNMRPFADFVNATMPFRAPPLDRGPCPISRKYFFRKFLPAQWNCCGEASKRGFLSVTEPRSSFPETGRGEPFIERRPGRESRYLTVLPTVIEFVQHARNRTAPSWAETGHGIAVGFGPGQDRPSDWRNDLTKGRIQSANAPS